MDVEKAARHFAQVLREAWVERDIDRFAALYADGAPFRGPFAEPESAVEHMRRAFELGEATPEVWVGEPAVSHERASVEWWGVVMIGGEPHSFAGTAWVRFDDDGRVVEENDYWHAAPGRVEPWPGWGGELGD
jgi:hypothetical protein